MRPANSGGWLTVYVHLAGDRGLVFRAKGAIAEPFLCCPGLMEADGC